MAEEPFYLLRVALGMFLSWVITWKEGIPNLRGIGLHPPEKMFLASPHQPAGLSIMNSPGVHAGQDGAAWLLWGGLDTGQPWVASPSS